MIGHEGLLLRKHSPQAHRTPTPSRERSAKRATQVQTEPMFLITSDQSQSTGWTLEEEFWFRAPYPGLALSEL